MKEFHFDAEIEGHCAVVVKAKTLEEALLKLDDGDFTCEGEEWEANVTSREPIDILDSEDEEE